MREASATVREEDYGVTEVVQPTFTQVALTADQNPSQSGQTVTFTATVGVPAVQGGPSGTVSFYDNGTLLATVAVGPQTGTNSRAVYAAAGLTAGSHPITATYNGDQNFASSTGSLTQTVNSPPPGP